MIFHHRRRGGYGKTPTYMLVILVSVTGVVCLGVPTAAWINTTGLDWVETCFMVFFTVVTVALWIFLTVTSYRLWKLDRNKI